MLFGRSKKNPIKIADKGVVNWKYTTCGYCSTGCSIEVGLNKYGDAVTKNLKKFPGIRRLIKQPMK
jgi:assimilatory nitrate reductase catalytic subunit